MEIKDYERQIKEHIFEDRTGATRLYLKFFCQMVDQLYESYITDLRTPESTLREYLLDECNIEPSYIYDWVNTEAVQDIFIGDLLEFEGFVNGNIFARNLNRFYRASGYRVHFQSLLGISLEPGTSGVVRLLNGIAQTAFPWELEFTDDFYNAVFLHYNYAEKHQCGQFISNYVYGWFPELVTEKLDKVNPRIEDERFRKKCLHQFFKGETLEELKYHIKNVTLVLNCSRDKIDFREKMKMIPKIITKYDRNLRGSNDKKLPN